MSTTVEREPRPLTPEELAKPYAKYYTMDLGGPDLEALELLRRDRQMDAAKALMPEDISALLDPGYHEVETGWCMLPNGGGYIAVLHKMPGVTVEMIDWWFAWHAIEDLRYRIWYPPYHLGIGVDEWARPRLLDPDVPVRDKCRHIIHHVTEDVGMGAEHIDIHFLGPDEMGFDMERFVAPNVGTFVGGFGFSLNEHQPPDIPAAPAIMCHFIREIPGGIEFRSRFWMGYTLIDRKPVFMLPSGVKVPEAAVQGLAEHNVREYTNLRNLLPGIYKELEGKWVV